jgi:hypothetical protein
MSRYRTKTDAELRYIVRDAGEAARAMRDVDQAAEAKYLDQVNDACSELYRRQTLQRIGRAPVPGLIAMR